MSERIWNDGPPPHIGWHNASWGWNEDVWRWWDGICWSCVALPSYSANDAMKIALEKESIFDNSSLYWSDYWPENARVPRIKP